VTKTIAALYCRKSNDQLDRDESVKSVTAQREACESFARAKGWTVGPVFSDDGVTGAVFLQRPGLQQLLAALKPAPRSRAWSWRASRVSAARPSTRSWCCARSSARVSRCGAYAKGGGSR